MTQKHSGAELRAKFLSFFKENQHEVVKSAPLIPQNDPTLLFVNAGMVPFKEVFTGREDLGFKRATSSQKCVRAGGKHNDLENVGRTARHHTFFEMLGNFSFGAYFKEEACKMAWQFLTKEVGIDAKRLTVTVFGGEDGMPADTDAERIWHEVVGVPKAQISRCGAKDNFWSMGDTGPCGPCTEIHYERGDIEGTFGGDDPEGDRVLEVWNLVFMQFERHADGSLSDLPNPCVDTGMGLERLAMVMNECASNYDTDLLRPMITLCETELKKAYTSSDSDDDVAMRVVADHARATCFLMADGVLPGNGKREYVLRRIMRRAIRFGDRLGYHEPFFARICLKVIDIFEEAFPELTEARALIEKMVTFEELTFRRTLANGLERFSQSSEGLRAGDVFDGRVVYQLKETYGFPTDLTMLLLEEKGFKFDEAGYLAAEKLHIAASKGEMSMEGIPPVFRAIRKEHGATVFTGYEASNAKADGKVIALVKKGESVQSANKGDRVQVITDQTPFYAESGGQVGDRGLLEAEGVKASVTDTAKIAELHVMTCKLKEGSIKVGDALQARVDTERLQDVARNHSATHLVHRALREVLGDHVTQKGSLVNDQKLRFDFAHFAPLSDEELVAVEDRVNALVLENIDQKMVETSFDAAKELGAMALFGEKYSEDVRVISFGPSVELCGGIHVGSTGEIGLFKITDESALAAGIRRLEAVTGRGALAYVRDRDNTLSTVGQALGVPQSDLVAKVESLRAQMKSLEKEVNAQRQKQASASAEEALKGVRKVDGIKVLTERKDGLPSSELRGYADKLRDKLGSGVVAVGTTDGKKVALLVAVTPDLEGTLHAGKLVGEMAKKVDGRGGGKPGLAQAGGQNPSGLDDALAMLDDLVAAVVS